MARKRGLILTNIYDWLGFLVFFLVEWCYTAEDVKKLFSPRSIKETYGTFPWYTIKESTFLLPSHCQASGRAKGYRNFSLACKPGGRVPHWALRPLLLSGRKSFHDDPGLDLARALNAWELSSRAPIT